LLGDALRKVHGSGKVHGAVSPESIVLTEGGIDLTPAPGVAEAVTPYSAPETLEGRPADFPTDIFSFGTLLYEMLTGRKAFTGETSAELAVAIATTVPAPTGVPGVDQLIAACLAKESTARPQSIQKVLLELKLLSVAARRAEVTAAIRHDAAETRLRAEMHQFEARVAARLEERERSAVAMQQEASDALNTLRTQLITMGAELTAAQERSAQLQSSVEAAGQRLSAQEQQSKEANAALERSIDSAQQHSATIEIRLGEDLHNCEKKIEAQTAVIESVRTSLAETDRLVERLVEAMEMLQNIVLDSNDAL